MPSTHTSLHYHLVFSTKHREPWFDRAWRDRMHEYLGGCIRAEGGISEEIGGVADHVHLLISLRPTHCLSDFMREVKQGSSEWVHTTFKRSAFAWQEGYGAFSVSASHVERVRTYIRGQEKHHRKTSYQDEYRKLLERHGIKFEERFLW